MLGFVFPGQGSQYAGMGRQLLEVSDKVGLFFDYLSNSLEIDIREICCDLSEDELRRTENAQIALYAYCMGLFELVKEADVLKEGEVYCFAGHSVGEYAALAAAGILSVEDGAALVYRRGQIMADADQFHVGGMVAVLGSSREEIEYACNEVRGDDVLVIANYNSPVQVVVSGNIEAIGRLVSRSKELNLKKVVRLNVSGGFHSPLMDKSATAMSLILRQVRFRPTNNIVLSNVTGDKVSTFLDWSRLLEDQLKKPVLWVDVVNNMVKCGVGQFIEVGPSQVLSGLIKKVVPSCFVRSIQSVSDIRA